MPTNKVVSIEEAISHVKSGMTLAIGGLLNQGVPLTLIRALKETDVTGLTICANDGGFGEEGTVELIKLGKVRRLVASHVGYTPAVVQAYLNRQLEVVWTPQGTLAEMMRCAGAGLGGFLTPAGLGSAVAAGKQVLTVKGREYLLEEPLRADVAFVRAHSADTWGNLCYRRTARNFNPVVATCADYVIAEVEHLNSVGDLDPETIHTSSIYIDALVRVGKSCHPNSTPVKGVTTTATTLDSGSVIGARAAQELRDGEVICLGAGLPMMLTSHVPEGVQVIIQSLNGMVGAGPAPDPGSEDPDCGNSIGQPASLLPGGTYIDTLTSFSMIRGGHVQATFLGALQVDQEGNIASFEIPGVRVWGLGGAMDLIAGAATVYVLTEHCSKDGSSKLLKRCTLPLSGAGRCDAIITERALFRRSPAGGFTLEEVATGYTLDDIRASTEMDYAVSDSVRLQAFGTAPGSRL